MFRFPAFRLFHAMSLAMLVTVTTRGGARAQDVTRVTVDLAGLRLDSPSGRAEAERRIARAASRVLGEPDLRDLDAMAEFEQRREQIIRRADAELDCLIARVQARHDETFARSAGSGSTAVAGSPRAAGRS